MDDRLVLYCTQLRRVVQEYVDYYNDSRPHQGIEQRVPTPYHQPAHPPRLGRITVQPVLGGLHHAYSRAAYLH